MTTRYPGGLIRKTPPTITPPVGGEGGSAPGVWTLEQASYYTKTGTWPKPIIPRAIYSWGANDAGQLGLNDTVYRSSPTQVGTDNNWSQISSTDKHSLAIKTTGSMWAWGQNNFGQLGQSDVVFRSSPVQIGALTTWSQISAGNGFCLAIKTDGTLWSWGRNQYGQLGRNNLLYRSSPVQVGALTTWSQIATGNSSVFSVKTDGTMWSWGDDFFWKIRIKPCLWQC